VQQSLFVTEVSNASRPHVMPLLQNDTNKTKSGHNACLGLAELKRRNKVVTAALIVQHDWTTVQQY